MYVSPAESKRLAERKARAYGHSTEQVAKRNREARQKVASAVRKDK